AAPVDPFVSGWAVINGHEDGIDVEEAAMQTAALPWGLQVTGGRFFAPFGRLSQWHDHELSMVDRPNSLLTYVGGEGQADGVLVSWLAPTPFFLRLSAGTFSKLGADNNRVAHTDYQGFDRWTHLVRAHLYTDLTDNVGLDLGASLAWTPKSVFCPSGACALNDSWRTLGGADATLRYMPSAGGLYKGLVWSTEVLQNDERGFDPFTSLPTGRMLSYSGYSNVETKVGRMTRLGAFVDLSELPGQKRDVCRTFAAYWTLEFSEFNRLRLQYSRILNSFGGALAGLPGTDFAGSDLVGLRAGHMISLQWTTVLGYHVHGFRGRWGA
ncbi:MAG: hypothetical protein KGK30_02050, partial [Elusimicrobia bacterium]|nr:hypothetical protein [Elusimicrobiota bacterium]